MCNITNCFSQSAGVILDEEDLELEEVKVERVVLNESGKRAIRLDTSILKSGRNTKYRDLPATIIIFITQDDLFGKNLAMYTFTEQCKEVPGLELSDGTTKLFLNMKSRN